MTTINYDTLPSHMRDAARNYIENGIPPGSFLTAVICNDLMGAFRRADDINRAAMWDWARFFYTEAPPACWGREAKMDEWVYCGGLTGRDAEEVA